MAKELINRGVNANDGDGDSLRTGADKINANFAEIYSVLGDGVNLLTTDIDFGINKIFYTNAVANETELAGLSASKYLGLPVYVQATGALYYGHSTGWKKLLSDNSQGNVQNYTDSLDNVAYSGNYNDLNNRPVIPSKLTDISIVDGSAGQVLSTDGTGNFTFRDVSATTVEFSSVINKPTTLAGYGINDAFTGRYEDLLNKPVLFSGAYADLTGKPTIPTDVDDLTDNTGLLFSKSYLDLTDRPDIPSDLSDLTDSTNRLFSRSYNDLTDIPTTFGNLQEISMALGVAISEFSNDVALTDNSATALVTERAVKTYVLNKFSELPAVPDSILDLGITDGTAGQVLSANGDGSFTFIDQSGGDTIGNFTLSASVIDTDDSSAITITPAVVLSSDLTVENDLTVNGDIITASTTGTPEIYSNTDILLTATDRVTVTQTPFKLASFTTAERDLLVAENGDTIYNTTTNKFQGYANGTWVDLH